MRRLARGNSGDPFHMPSSLPRRQAILSATTGIVSAAFSRQSFLRFVAASPLFGAEGTSVAPVITKG